MTRDASPSIEATGMPAAIAALRARRLRVSGARRIVLAALLTADGPATAEQLASGLDGRTTPSDPGSMYRNLDTFVQIGLVRHVQFGTGAGRYVLSARCEGGYATCARCEAFEPLPLATCDALRRELRATCAIGTGSGPLTVVGLCASCEPH